MIQKTKFPCVHQRNERITLLKDCVQNGIHQIFFALKAKQYAVHLPLATVPKTLGVWWVGCAVTHVRVKKR